MRGFTSLLKKWVSPRFPVVNCHHLPPIQAPDWAVTELIEVGLGKQIGSEGVVQLKFCTFFYIGIVGFSLGIRHSYIYLYISRFVNMYQDDYWCDLHGPGICHHKFWRRHQRHQEERTPTWLGTLVFSWKWMLRYSPFDNIISKKHRHVHLAM